MPIRSPRGRAAAYRTLWQWPLRSPARLAVTLVAVVALASGIGLGLGATTGSSNRGLLADAAEPAPATSSARRSPGPSTTPVPTALPPVPALAPTTLPLSAAPAAALDVAARWAAAWVDHPPGTTSEQWLAGLRDVTTPEYLPTLGAVDPANVPANAVTGAPRAVRVAPRSVQVEVPTDALTLVVVVVDTDTGWRVTSHERA
ncbi:MAG TPA: hypothetical protein VM367_02980 [Pseudonocardia sp.]|nr:hypothetical protein [Pseudonocardia sp.]